MTGTVIYKLSGSGNDFVMLDGRNERLDEWPPDRIRATCARGTGVGADGLVLLEPGSGPGRVRFHFFNSDGGRAPMCGNGALCATRLAAWLELAPATGLVLETDAGEVSGRFLGGEAECAEIALPEPAPVVAPAIRMARGERAIHFTTVGVPHLVVLVDDVASVPLLTRGRELRSHSAVGPGGANVNFVAHGAPWTMRTYERGVEAETLACGTGAVACAAVVTHRGESGLPFSVRTSAGTVLTVAADSAGSGTLKRPLLTGPARLVFRGVLGS
jgi:diaminopimelate epimerase